MRISKEQIEQTSSKAVERLETLGQISDSHEYLTRSFLSPANIQAAKVIMGWMSEMGLEVEHTLDGSIRGILKGENPDAQPLLLGSHFDTVTNAGKYDGPLGIISSLAALELIIAEGAELPFPVHVLGFSDEEGGRFHTTYLGSKGMIGDWSDKMMSAVDNKGHSLTEVIQTEGWEDQAVEILYKREEARAYIELHIEQGIILEDMGEPVSGVSAIAGQSRLNVRIIGQADHAGTTPMNLRTDALTGAADCILAAESLAQKNAPAVITVGQAKVHPGASNAIPGEVVFSIDLRHPEDAKRASLQSELIYIFKKITAARKLELDWSVIMEENATPCDEEMSSRLLDAVEQVTGKRTCLMSGAGHDGVAMSKVAPIAMIFVRCRDGLSHHPNEFASPEDISAGIHVLVNFLSSYIK